VLVKTGHWGWWGSAEHLLQGCPVETGVSRADPFSGGLESWCLQPSSLWSSSCLALPSALSWRFSCFHVSGNALGWRGVKSRSRCDLLWEKVDSVPWRTDHRVYRSVCFLERALLLACRLSRNTSLTLEDHAVVEAQKGRGVHSFPALAPFSSGLWDITQMQAGQLLCKLSSVNSPFRNYSVCVSALTGFPVSHSRFKAGTVFSASCNVRKLLNKYPANLQLLPDVAWGDRSFVVRQKSGRVQAVRRAGRRVGLGETLGGTLLRRHLARAGAQTWKGGLVFSWLWQDQVLYVVLMSILLFRKCE